MINSAHMPMIHVGIMQAKEIRFELNGQFTDDSQNNCSGPVIARVSGSNIILKCNNQEKTVPEEISFIPEDPETAGFKVYGVTIGIGFHWQKAEDQVFKGGVKMITGESVLTIINMISVEDYLISVISSEMNARSSAELLKSHAVISRSWLLAQIEKRKEIKNQPNVYNSISISEDEIIRWYDREDHTRFDVCADDHCQRYQGITKASNIIVEKAVKETTGEVLMFKNRLCDSRFSKCCGGVTELFENVWEPVNHPYLSEIYDYPGTRNPFNDLSVEANAYTWITTSPEAFCNATDKNILSQVLNDYDQITHDFFRWKVVYSFDELSSLIKKKTGIDFGEITSLEPVERGVSGRLIRLRITGTKKTMIIGKELEIRKVLSETHLYSSAFVVEKSDTSRTFTLIGAGWGHGVGLCQIGAAVMGEKGYSYREILLHYFRGANIEKRW